MLSAADGASEREKGNVRKAIRKRNTLLSDTCKHDPEREQQCSSTAAWDFQAMCTICTTRHLYKATNFKYGAFARCAVLLAAQQSKNIVSIIISMRPNGSYSSSACCRYVFKYLVGTGLTVFPLSYLQGHDIGHLDSSRIVRIHVSPYIGSYSAVKYGGSRPCSTIM